MSSLPGFLLRIAKATNPPEEGAGMMSIIIRRAYAHLEKELCRAFEGQEDVKVIVDSRYGERPTSEQPGAMGRRQADRRSPKEELIKVLVSTWTIWSRSMDSNKPEKPKSFFFEKYSQRPIAV